MDDVRAAADVGFVQGVTTNPKLLPVPLEQALDTIRTILEVLPLSRVFHQVRAEDDEQFLTEADMVAGMSVWSSRCPRRPGTSVWPADWSSTARPYP